MINENHAHATKLNDFFTNTNSKGNARSDKLELSENMDLEIIPSTEIDSFDLTTGMQEAMHLSSIEMRQVPYPNKFLQTIKSRNSCIVYRNHRKGIFWDSE